MKFKRTVELDFDWMKHTNFKVGDTFTFKMKDGEKVKVRAVKEDAYGNMLFIFDDCLENEYTMKNIVTRGLLKRIYNRLPKKIKKMSVAFDDGEYLRLPTEKEIFGVNRYGEEESADVEQFKCMKRRKHRIAFQGFKRDGIYTRYWLNNNENNFNGRFVIVDRTGYSNSANLNASDVAVRPLLCLKNSTPP